MKKIRDLAAIVSLFYTDDNLIKRFFAVDAMRFVVEVMQALLLGLAMGFVVGLCC